MQRPQTSPKPRTAESTCVKITAMTKRLLPRSGVRRLCSDGGSQRRWCFSVWTQWQWNPVCWCLTAAVWLVSCLLSPKLRNLVFWVCNHTKSSAEVKPRSSEVLQGARCYLVVVFVPVWSGSSDPAEVHTWGIYRWLKASEAAFRFRRLKMILMSYVTSGYYLWYVKTGTRL